MNVNGVCISDIPAFASSQMNAFPHASWRVNISALAKSGALSSVWEHDGGLFSVPASNNKLFTTAAAYLALGETFTTTTRVYTTANGVCLQSSGDASLSHEVLHSLAKTVAAKVPSSIQEVQVDDSLFGLQDCPGGWEWGDMWYVGLVLFL